MRPMPSWSNTTDTTSPLSGIYSLLAQLSEIRSLALQLSGVQLPECEMTELQRKLLAYALMEREMLVVSCMARLRGRLLLWASSGLEPISSPANQERR